MALSDEQCEGLGEILDVMKVSALSEGFVPYTGKKKRGKSGKGRKRKKPKKWIPGAGGGAET